MFGIKRLKERIRDLELALADAQADHERALTLLNEKSSGTHAFSANYTITESDINKYGNDHQGMEKNAKLRMAGHLGRQIIKHLGADEIIEDGILIGYKIRVEARKARDTQE